MEPHYGSHNFRAITQATCLYVDANAAANENVFFFLVVSLASTSSHITPMEKKKTERKRKQEKSCADPFDD